MSQKSITDQNKVTGASLQLVGVDGELASLALSLMEIELWSHFKGLSSDCERDWLQFWSNLSARSHYLAEVIIGDAVDLWNILLPFLDKGLEHIIRDCDV